MFHFKQQLGFLILTSMVLIVAGAEPLAAQQQTPSQTPSQAPAPTPGQTQGANGTFQEDLVPIPKRQEPPFRKNRRLSPSIMEPGLTVPSTTKPNPPVGSGGVVRPRDPGQTPSVGRTPAAPTAPSAGSSTRGGPAESSSQSGLNVSYLDGTRTVRVKDAGRWITISEHEQRGIVVEITRSYTPKNHAELKRKLPDLKDYVEQFPTEVGDHEIQLSINVVSKYTAINAEELRIKNKRIFNLYQRYGRRIIPPNQANQANQGDGNSFIID